jgi:long-chain fatty acid transport protein
MWHSEPAMMTELDQRPGALGAALGLAVVFAAAPAPGSSVLETVGTPGAGNGFAARVVTRGTEATYYNPALLPDASSDLSFGILVLGTWGRIHLEPRPPGVDVSASVYDTDLAQAPSNGQRLWPQPTSQLLNPRADTVVHDWTPYVALGMARPLAGKVLVFGFYTLLPTEGFMHQKSSFPDEREQYFSNQVHFELLGDRLRVATVAAALGGRAFRELSWGAGVDIGMATRTHAQIYIPDAADQSRLLLVPEIETQMAAAPYFALALRPWTDWLITATLHGPKSWNTSGENRVRFWNYAYPNGQTAVVQAYELTQGAEPLRIGLGVGTSGKLGVNATGWRIGLQGVWTRWSRYYDRHGEHPLDPWHDTVTVGLGWGLDWGRRRLMAEFGVAPSPVPDQTGRTNYADNTSWGTSVGLEFPFSCLATDYALGLHLQGKSCHPGPSPRGPGRPTPWWMRSLTVPSTARRACRCPRSRVYRPTTPVTPATRAGPPCSA